VNDLLKIQYDDNIFKKLIEDETKDEIQARFNKSWVNRFACNFYDSRMLDFILFCCFSQHDQYLSFQSDFILSCFEVLMRILPELLLIMSSYLLLITDSFHVQMQRVTC